MLINTARDYLNLSYFTLGERRKFFAALNKEKEEKEAEIQMAIVREYNSVLNNFREKKGEILTGKELDEIKKVFREVDKLLPKPKSGEVDKRIVPQIIRRCKGSEEKVRIEAIKKQKKLEEKKKKEEEKKVAEEIKEKKEEVVEETRKIEKELWSEVARRRKWVRGQRLITLAAFISFILLILPTSPIQFPPTVKAALIIICLDLMSPGVSLALMIFTVAFQFLIKSSFEGWGGGFITIQDLLLMTEGIPILYNILGFLVNGFFLPLMNSLSSLGIWLLIYFIFSIITSILFGLGATMVYALLLAGSKALLLFLLLRVIPVWVGGWAQSCIQGKIPWVWIQNVDPNVCTNLAAVGIPFALELTLMLVGVDFFFTLFRPVIYRHVEEASERVKQSWKWIKKKREKKEEELEELEEIKKE